MSENVLRDAARACRRSLSFEHVSEIMPEVDRLLGGYKAIGRWDLGEICNHLAASVRYTIEGTNRRAPWILRRTIGPLLFRRINRAGRMPRGIRAPAEVRPKTGLDARAEAEALRATITLFEQYLGPIREHPFFGRVTKADLARLHCIHAAHHLSFLIPIAAPSEGNTAEATGDSRASLA